MRVRERKRTHSLSHTPIPQLPSNKTQRMVFDFSSFSSFLSHLQIQHVYFCCLKIVSFVSFVVDVCEMANGYPRHSTYKSLSSLENHISTKIIVQRDSIGSIDIPTHFNAVVFLFVSLLFFLSFFFYLFLLVLFLNSTTSPCSNDKKKQKTHIQISG